MVEDGAIGMGIVVVIDSKNYIEIDDCGKSALYYGYEYGGW